MNSGRKRLVGLVVGKGVDPVKRIGALFRFSVSENECGMIKLGLPLQDSLP